ncbi:hypothetical protein Anapl_07287 [Anas platyrhynchos]|uniref:Uncharacterized protein n=1 Tax=Anas platyrhynchos TaxID=8839 RepID=R0KLV0_ANAPL|nr:hypothetical protein Anapl_07287 [Anas platyrhynchos]
MAPPENRRLAFFPSLFDSCLLAGTSWGSADAFPSSCPPKQSPASPQGCRRASHCRMRQRMRGSFGGAVKSQNLSVALKPQKHRELATVQQQPRQLNTSHLLLHYEAKRLSNKNPKLLTTENKMLQQLVSGSGVQIGCGKRTKCHYHPAATHEHQSLEEHRTLLTGDGSSRSHFSDSHLCKKPVISVHAVLLMGVGHVVSGLLGLMSTLTARFEENLDQFSGVRTGNPWTVTFGNGSGGLQDSTFGFQPCFGLMRTSVKCHVNHGDRTEKLEPLRFIYCVKDGFQAVFLDLRYMYNTDLGNNDLTFKVMKKKGSHSNIKAIERQIQGQSCTLLKRAPHRLAGCQQSARDVQIHTHKRNEETPIKKQQQHSNLQKTNNKDIQTSEETFARVFFLITCSSVLQAFLNVPASEVPLREANPPERLKACRRGARGGTVAPELPALCSWLPGPCSPGTADVHVPCSTGSLVKMSDRNLRVPTPYDTDFIFKRP